DHLPWVEPLVERALRQELGKAGEIEPVRRHPRDDDRAALRGRPVGADMAGGAVQLDPLKAEIISLRGTDRPVHPLLEDKAERLPAIPRQVIATQFGKRLEDAGRDTGQPVTAGRAVFELLDRVVEKCFRRVARVIVIEVGARESYEKDSER